MMNGTLALALVAGAFGQLASPHYTPGKMALDMNVECVSLLGKNLYAEKAQGDAEKRLNEAAKHVTAQPENPDVHLELGNTLAALRRFHEAAQEYSKALALSPNSAGIYALRGDAFLTLRMFEQAKADFEHAAAIAPQSPVGWRGIGIASYLMHKFDDADKALGQAIALESDNVAKADIDLWKMQCEQRLGQDTTPNKLRPSGILSHYDERMIEYTKGCGESAKGQQDSAIEIWRALADSGDWTSPWVIAAEAEVAAVDGTKKMKPLV